MSELSTIFGGFARRWLLIGRPTPFVVFFAGRSGSTFLTSLLNSHPHVVCRHEIFHTVELSTKEANDPSIDGVMVDGRKVRRRVFPPHNDKKPVINPSKEVTVGMLKGLYSRSTAACGFKFKYPSQFQCYPEIVEELHALGSSLRVVLLRRRNVLKTAVSRQNLNRIMSQSDSELHCNLRSDVDMGPIRIDVDRALSYATGVLDEQRKAELLIEKFDNVLRIDYEDLIRDVDFSMRRILRHIEVSPKPKLSSDYFKATPDDLREAVENYDELENQVKGTEFEVFLDD